MFFTGGRVQRTSDCRLRFFQPEPSTRFHLVAKRYAEGLAPGNLASKSDVGVLRPRPALSLRILDTTAAFTKRRLSFRELTLLSLEGIKQLASAAGTAFEIPTPPRRQHQAVADWQAATSLVSRETTERNQRKCWCHEWAHCPLNRQTLAFIKDGAEEGSRARMLFSSAANLAEFGCPPELAHALLTEAALDLGLPPAEVYRQIGVWPGRIGAWKV